MNRQSCTGNRYQRGTAIFEGVIVFVVLVSVLAAGVYFQRNLLANLTRFHEARFSAWHAAMSGCYRSSHLARHVASMHSGEGLHRHSPFGQGRAELSVDEPPPLIERVVGRRGQVVVPCNEVMQVDQVELERIQTSMERALLPSL